MEPLRPAPRPSVADRARAAIDWIRLPRLVAMAVSVLIVAAGSWWLLSAPAPPIEQTLPFAAATTALRNSPNRNSGAPNPTNQNSGAPNAESTRPDPSASQTQAKPTQPSTAPVMLVVQAAGAVSHPGVYTLRAGSRVNDLVAACGGATADADAQAVNLAAQLVDGQRVYVPRIGEPAPATTRPATTRPVPSGSAPLGNADPVDVNHADVATIDQLPGIGPATAAAIVAYREASGPFASPDDLLKVKGIGPAKLDAIRDLVTT